MRRWKRSRWRPGKAETGCWVAHGGTEPLNQMAVTAYCRRLSPYASRVSLFNALGIARAFWPRCVSVLVVCAFFFAPHLSARLIEREAEVQAKQITSLFERALKSTGVYSDPHARPRPGSIVGGTVGPHKALSLPGEAR
jgi:hypothetical protein